MHTDSGLSPDLSDATLITARILHLSASALRESTEGLRLSEAVARRNSLTILFFIVAQRPLFSNPKHSFQTKVPV
jgi:hypothetical protein